MITAMACIAAVTSCSDNNADTPSTPQPQEEAKKDTADYTVIFWGNAGGNDHLTSKDMYVLAKNFQDGKIDNKKVNIAGMLKTTTAELEPRQNGEEIDWSKDSTIYFCSDTISKNPISAQLSEQAKDLLGKEQDKYTKEDFTNTGALRDTYDAAFATLNSKKYSVSYQMSNMDSLANFIQRSAKKFPARHYVLMLFGHGRGFSPTQDIPYTKVCLPDEYDNTYITADGLVNAVKKSGVETETLFTQCCLMGTLENMTAYSEVFHYGILSAEITGGGYFPEYLVKLTEAGDNEQKMKEKSKELVDYYVNVSSKDASFYTSHGFYDLSQMPQLLATVKEAAQWYAENYADKNLQYGIENAARGATVCYDTEYMDSVFSANRQTLREIALERHDISDVTPEDLKDAVSYLEYLTGKKVSTTMYQIGFCFSDLLKSTMESKEEDNIPAEKTAQIKAIYEKYMKALKAMAYIGTTLTPANASADYPYIYASPTINILALNEAYYTPLGGGDKAEEYLEALYQAIDDKNEGKMLELFAKLFEGNIFATIQPDVNITKANYQASAFDKQVGWSKFLEQIQFNPSLILNPVRREAYEE